VQPRCAVKTIRLAEHRLAADKEAVRAAGPGVRVRDTAAGLLLDKDEGVRFQLALSLGGARMAHIPAS
jgi:hypothetical protein